MPIDERIHQVVEDFVARVTSLAREAAVETLRARLSADGSQAPAPSRRAPSKATRPASTRSLRKGAKRPKADIAQLEALLAKHIAKQPGQRVEQINAALGTTTRDVRLPLAKLIAAKAVKTKGTRRATTYYPT